MTEQDRREAACSRVRLRVAELLAECGGERTARAIVFALDDGSTERVEEVGARLVEAHAMLLPTRES